ncbi:MAG: peptidoglycan-binding protein [Clostridia bacterium]|nr:peptidoglycan-binding protein [Clostridia bacterium]
MATPINKEQAITNLQRYLRRLSYEGLDGKRVPIDGILGSTTREALSEFQRAEGLPVTGTADKRTWDAIFEEYSLVTQNERLAECLDPFPKNPPDYSVSLGDTLTLVSIIQLLLLELRATYDIFEDISESGVFDEQTEQAVREFQLKNGLPPTGKVDRTTWNRIVREYSSLELREE